MGKKKSNKIIDHKIIIRVEDPWAYKKINKYNYQESPEYNQDLENSIQWVINDIKRHVDGIDGIDWEVIFENQCEFCKSEWTEDGNVYNGGCCDEDEKNNPEPEEE